MMRRAIRLASLTLVLTTLGFAQSQSPAVGLAAQTDTGTRDYIPYDGATENVNLTNGNVNLKIPLVHLPGRNGLDLDLNLEYDSKFWKLDGTFNADTGTIGGAWKEDVRWPYVAKGWHLNIPTVNYTSTLLYTAGGTLYGCSGTTTVILWDGARYNFSNNPTCPSPYQIGVMDTEDNSGARFTIGTVNTPTVLALRNGTKIYFGSNGFGVGIATKIVDANGNFISISSSGYTVYSMTDSVGRIVQFNGGAGFSWKTGGLNSITFPDPNAPGGTFTISLGYTDIALSWYFYQPIPNSKGNPPVVVSSRTGSATKAMLTSLSVGSHVFSFEYAQSTYRGGTYNFGELTKITYPTGGYATYTYGAQSHVELELASSTDVYWMYADFREVSQKQSCPIGAASCATTTYAFASSTSNNDTATVSYPDGHTETHNFTQETIAGQSIEPYHGNAAHETQVVIKSSSGTVLRTIATTYSGQKTWDLPTDVNTTLDSAGPMKKEHFDYDTFSATYQPWVTVQGGQYQPSPTTVTRMIDNVTQHLEYDWGATTVLRKTTTSYIHTNSVNGQDYYSTPIRILNLKDTATVYDGATALEQTKFEYDNYTGNPLTTSGATQHDSISIPRGNLTSYKRCQTLSGATCSTWSSPTAYQYEDAGNLVKITDPNGHYSQFSYTDSWGTNGATCAPASGNAATYLTTSTDGAGLVTTAKYNSCRGTLASFSDPNLVTTTYGYDQYARRTNITFPVEAAGQGQINVTYAETASPFKVTTTGSITSSLNLVNTTMLDGFGRACETQLTSDPDGATVIDTVYNGMGQKQYVTNPYRPGSLPSSCPSGTPSVPYTAYQYDGLGRTLQVTEPDNSPPVTSSYVANCTTVTDEATKKRKSCVDGLDRISQVFEDPTGLNYETDYKYSPQGLTCVEQHGGVTGTGCSSDPSNDPTSPWRVRRFGYDALGRLTSAKNPESGTITYTYPVAANPCSGDLSAPCSKTDARLITTNYQYNDGDNRLTGKTYSNNDPAVTYAYDAYVAGTNYGRGHRTSMQVGSTSNSASWVYDIRGRASTVNRTVNGYSKSFTFGYNLDSSVATVQYPSGKILNYQPGGAARTLRVWDTSIGTDYVNTVTYTPSGALAGAKIGANITLTNTYNSRLQPITLSATANSNTLMSRTYDFHLSTGDNGNVWGVTDNVDSLNISTRPIGSATFSYDNLNRTTGFSTTGTDCMVVQQPNVTKNSGNSYTVDAWGNLAVKTVTKCTAEPLSETADKTNRFVPAGPASGRYDAAGNMVQYGAYVFDGESRITTGGGLTFTYDGDGNRIAKTGTTNELYWWGTESDALAESDASGHLTSEYIFFDGKRVARFDFSNSSVHYYISDHLGSATVIADVSGGNEREQMYFPYGGERWGSGTDPNHYKFTGKERDSETGLDYFGARYYGSNIGRWMSPDWSDAPEPVPYAELSDPQTLNLYQYVRNNPLSGADLTGHDCPPLCTVDQIGQVLGQGFTGVLVAAGEWGGALSGGGLLAALGSEMIADPKGENFENLRPGGMGVMNADGMLPEAHREMKAQNEQTKAQEGKQEGPVKAKDAPGVTAGGQATNEHGQKLAPSGKPQINNVNKNTREKANNAANKGSGTIEDRNPTRGKPHFHTKRGTGKKKRDGAHYNYPE